jgi:glucuronate isomerase
MERLLRDEEFGPTSKSTMSQPFLHEDFLLGSEPARRLYHDSAAGLPIFDYHCHLPVLEIAENRSFENLTRV